MATTSARFTSGTQQADTGKTDLQAMVDYMAEFAGGTKPPLPVDYTPARGRREVPGRRSGGVRGRGPREFDLSSLAFSTAADLKDTEVTV